MWIGKGRRSNSLQPGRGEDTAHRDQPRYSGHHQEFWVKIDAGMQTVLRLVCKAIGQGDKVRPGEKGPEKEDASEDGQQKFHRFRIATSRLNNKRRALGPPSQFPALTAGTLFCSVPSERPRELTLVLPVLDQVIDNRRIGER